MSLRMWEDSSKIPLGVESLMPAKLSEEVGNRWFLLVSMENVM